MQEATSTHLETCTCHEIRSLVNETVQQATANLESKIRLMIDRAISNITTTEDIALSNLESSLTSTVEKLLRPIQRQLDYHLPFEVLNNSRDNPGESCKSLYAKHPDAQSGHYWIKVPGSSEPVRVYCRMMDGTTDNLTGGWMRVAYIDMKNSSHQCPNGLTLTTRSSEPRRVCDTTSYSLCVSNLFTAHGVEYSHVYGRIIAYQNRVPAAFVYRNSNFAGNFNELDDLYVFGVSLTHGQNPRKHIWTFAGASDESSSDPGRKCPCTNTQISSNSSIKIPSFIGSDYFCDTALSLRYINYNYELYPDDPLWDGQGCGSTSTCCSLPNKPPWFTKNLPTSTTDDIEMRYCKPANDGSTPIEVVELYVQ